MRARTNIARVLAIIAICFASTVSAMLPESGWYWNPTESGRGFNIEIQNNVLFMSGFVYDASGKPIWVVGSCVMTSDRNCSAVLYQTSGGQCIGCAYGGPPAIAQYGTAVITFTSETTALVTVNGIALSLQRQAWAIDLTNVATPLLGEWAIVSGSVVLPVYFGDKITFSLVVSSGGTTGAGGSRTGDIARVAVGSLTPAGWGILFDSSPSYYTLFVFSFAGLNTIAGDAAVYLKGTQPTGSLPFIANRIRSAAAAQGGNAPGFTPRALVVSPASAASSAADEARSAAMVSASGSTLARLQDMARTLEPLLNNQK